MTDLKINLAESQGIPIEPFDAPEPKESSVEIKKQGIMLDSAESATNVQTKTASEVPQSPLENIFNQKGSSLAQTRILSSVIDNKDVTAKVKPILGNAQMLQKTLEYEKEHKQKQKLRFIQIIFTLIVFVCAGVSLYFYNELSPSLNLFGKNTASQLLELNRNVRSLQATVNKYRYLSVQLDLSRFSYLASQFLDQSLKLKDPNLIPSEKQQLLADVNAIQIELPEILQRIQGNLRQNIVAVTYRDGLEPPLTEIEIQQQAEEDIKNALREDRTAFAKNTQNPESLQQADLIDNTIKLIGNKSLLKSLTIMTPQALKQDMENYINEEDRVKRNALQNFLTSILASAQSKLSRIGSLKGERIEWLTLIKQIEMVTRDKDVDPYFGSNAYQAIGYEISYNGYEFDSSNQKITLSGVVKTKDAKNFSLITRLIDKLEQSPYFKNIQMRSFPKNGNNDQGYVTNFKIELNLESETNVSSSKPVSLYDKKIIEKGKKRIRK